MVIIYMLARTYGNTLSCSPTVALGRIDGKLHQSCEVSLPLYQTLSIASAPNYPSTPALPRLDPEFPRPEDATNHLRRGDAAGRRGSLSQLTGNLPTAARDDDSIGELILPIAAARL